MADENSIVTSAPAESVSTTETADGAAVIAPEAGAAASAGDEGNFEAALALLTGQDAPAPKVDAVAEVSKEPEAAPVEAPKVEVKQDAVFDKLRKAEAAKQEAAKEAKALKAELAELKAAREAAKLHPQKAMEFLGLTAEQFQDQLIRTGGVLSDEAKMALEAKQEIAQMRAEAAERAKAQEAAQQQQIMADDRRRVHNFIQSKSDDYELSLQVLGDGATDAVINAILTHGAENQAQIAAGELKPLTFSEAAEQVERELEAAVFEKVLKTKKVQTRLNATATKSAPQRSSQTPTKTLTASMSPSTGKSPELLSDADRFEAALKMISR